MLDNLRNGLKAVGSAATADAVLTSLLESLNEHFAAVALFAIGARRSHTLAQPRRR